MGELDFKLIFGDNLNFQVFIEFLSLFYPHRNYVRLILSHRSILFLKLIFA